MNNCPICNRILSECGYKDDLLLAYQTGLKDGKLELKFLHEEIALLKEYLRKATEGQIAFFPKPDSLFWLIWSNEHQSWWKPASAGYTNRIYEAGRYSLKKARQICEHASVGSKKGIPDEVAVPSPELIKELMKIK